MQHDTDMVICNDSLEVFCPVPGCARQLPYKIPGWMTSHLASNHANLFPSEKEAAAKADVLFALETQAALARGIQPVVAQGAAELEEGEIYEEVEEMSGTVCRATLPLLGVLPEEPETIPVRPSTSHGGRSASLSTRLTPPAPKNTIKVPGLSVTVIYDLETTG